MAKIKGLQLRQMRDKLNKKEESDILQQISHLDKLMGKASPAEAVEKEVSSLTARLEK